MRRNKEGQLWNPFHKDCKILIKIGDKYFDTTEVSEDAVFATIKYCEVCARYIKEREREGGEKR